MSLIKNINGNKADDDKMLLDLSSDLIEAMGEYVEIFPGVAIEGYVEEGLIIAESLVYEDVESLKSFTSLYELIDSLIILNPRSANIVTMHGGTDLITYPGESLYVYTFSKNSIAKGKMLKYYKYIFEMGN